MSLFATLNFFQSRNCIWEGNQTLTVCMCSGGANGAAGGVRWWLVEGGALWAHRWCLQAHHPHLRTAQRLWGILRREPILKIPHYTHFHLSFSFWTPIYQPCTILYVHICICIFRKTPYLAFCSVLDADAAFYVFIALEMGMGWCLTTDISECFILWN